MTDASMGLGGISLAQRKAMDRGSIRGGMGSICIKAWAELLFFDIHTSPRASNSDQVLCK